mgnify:CR=1 FL=1
MHATAAARLAHAAHAQGRTLTRFAAARGALLGRPARVCEIQIKEADDIMGPAILVAWRLTADEDIRGFTVYRVPESLDPTPVRPPD